MSADETSTDETSDDRPDGHSWFKAWGDALGQADRRAWLTRRRHRVHYDAANRWWNITETHDLLVSEADR